MATSLLNRPCSQVWFNDIKFNEEPVYDVEERTAKPMKDFYGHVVENPVVKVDSKIKPTISSCSGTLKKRTAEKSSLHT
jgi:hypothetical protein